MATMQEMNEFEELGEFFRRLRQTCELQGSDFKQQLRDDSALKAKFTRFKTVATRVKEHKRIQKEQATKATEEATKSTLHSISFSARKNRKRRYAEVNTDGDDHINPRKRLKRYRNNVGFSPSFGNRNALKPIVDKENVPNETPLIIEENVRKATLAPLSIQKPSRRNMSQRHRKLLSNRTSLKNRINFKEKEKKEEEENKSKAQENNDDKTQIDTNDEVEQENENTADINMEAEDDDRADDESMANDEAGGGRKRKRNCAKTPKAAKKKKNKKERKAPHTVKPQKKKKRTVRKKKKPTAKTSKKNTKRKTKDEGAGVSKNFKKIDLKHKRYFNKHKRKSNRPNRKKKFNKFDKFEHMKRQREETLKKNNLNLSNLEQLKLEVFSDSDDHQNIDNEEEKASKTKEEKEVEHNPYSERLNDVENDDAIDEVLHDVLLKEYGYSEYRRGQKEAIKCIMQKHSTLLLLPTGAGKSICYQIPTILWKNKELKPLTLVISPLRSLMRDQCDNLPKCLRGKVWDSSLDRNDIYRLTKQLIAGDINVLFIAPEKLDNNYFQSLLKNTIGSERLMFACIDEAHCISEWSHNFRPSYLKLQRILKEQLHVGCILACTATATVITQNSITQNLNIASDHVVNALAKRENLHLTVSHIGRGLNKEQKLYEMIKSERFKHLKSLIVYVCTRREVQSVASKLKQLKRYNGVTEVDGYHAGMDNKERERVQAGFMRGDIHIIVATIAFGMGLNKSDVRGVIHYSVPASMEHYVQEVGRAGRDGLGSECHVFYDREDIDRKRSWIYKNGVDLTQIKQLLFDIFSSKNVHLIKNRLKKQKEKSMKKIFQHKRKKKKKTEDDFSDEDIDDIEDDLILTEFQHADDIVVISKGKNTERKYDAAEAVLATIFTYLDVYKSEYIVQLPSHNDLVRIGLTKKENEIKSEIIRFIINCYNPKNGVYLVHLGKLYNDLRHIEIEDEEGEIINIEKQYSVYQISKHLKDLEYQKCVTLSYDDDCFVLMVKKQMRDHDELVALCDNVFDYISKHEKSDLEKINTMAQALKIIANNNEGIVVEDEDVDENKEENVEKEKKSISLHELVEQYFRCENHDEFLDLVQSYLPSYDHIRTQPVSKSNMMYAGVKKSVTQFLVEYPKIQRPRSIAKIFHGFASPRYGYKELQANHYNQKHMQFPFMQIMQIAKEVMEEKKEKKNEMLQNDNTNKEESDQSSDDNSD